MRHILKMVRAIMKMVHNGIEYGDMQMICEAYHLMKGSQMPANEIGRTLKVERRGFRFFNVYFCRCSSTKRPSGDGFLATRF